MPARQCRAKRLTSLTKTTSVARLHNLARSMQLRTSTARTRITNATRARARLPQAGAHHVVRLRHDDTSKEDGPAQTPGRPVAPPSTPAPHYGAGVATGVSTTAFGGSISLANSSSDRAVAKSINFPGSFPNRSRTSGGNVAKRSCAPSIRFTADS